MFIISHEPEFTLNFDFRSLVKIINAFKNKLAFACYDFHHYKGLKDFELSKARHKDWKEVEKELERCIVICSNCHRAVHYLHEQITK